MPGFTINGTGGDNKISSTAETKRTYRWRFNTIGDVISQEIAILLKSAARPAGQLQEIKMDHNQEEVWFAGKTSWEPISMIWYDAQQPDVSAKIWEWYNKTSPIKEANVNEPSEYKKQGQLEMVDGMGSPIETWMLYNCWPQSVNFQGLDYTTNDIITVEVKMRYDRAERE